MRCTNTAASQAPKRLPPTDPGDSLIAGAQNDSPDNIQYPSLATLV